MCLSLALGDVRHVIQKINLGTAQDQWKRQTEAEGAVTSTTSVSRRPAVKPGWEVVTAF